MFSGLIIVKGIYYLIASREQAAGSHVSIQPRYPGHHRRSQGAAYGGQHGDAQLPQQSTTVKTQPSGAPVL